MRLKLNFKLSGKKQVLPLNYQYPISAWIYKVLDKADNEFTSILHDNGYTLENGKTFKLFTFSKLQFPKNTWKIIPKSDRMEVWSRNAYLTISFQLPEQTEKFVIGLFKEQKAFIGDKISGIDLEVENIEALKTDVPESKTLKLKTITPIVLGINVEGKENEQYLSPITADYNKLILKNLHDKYRATGKSEINLNDLAFNVTKLFPKTEMQTIKAHTPAETKVRAYHFEFELTAPKELVEIGLNSGFGSMNSIGFGFCEIISDKHE